MKLTTIKFIKLNLLVLCISVIMNANAKPEDECEKQLLSTQGLSVSGNTISPGQIFPISLVSDKGKVEATIELSLKKMKNTVVVDGEIKNIGNCVISTFMPVGLHPIKNGLPLKWHTLPEGLKHSSPTLKPGEFVKFFKKYSKEYAWGFNIKVGTFWLSPSDKPTENNLDACSDKAIAKQLEKIADNEIGKELDACQSAEAMNRVNNRILNVVEGCKSKMSLLINKEIRNNIADSTLKINNACIDSNKNSENIQANQHLNDMVGTTEQNSSENESFNTIILQSIQSLQNLQKTPTPKATNKSRGCGPPRCGIKE